MQSDSSPILLFWEQEMDRWDRKQRKTAALSVKGFQFAEWHNSISPERKENTGMERGGPMTMAGLKKPRQPEWRPFSSSARDTNPRNPRDNGHKPNEGSHCLQPAHTQTIGSILVVLFCMLLRFHWSQAHNTIYFSYARWLDVGLRRKPNDFCHTGRLAKSHIWIFGIWG